MNKGKILQIVFMTDSEVEVTEGNGKQLNFKEFCAKVEQTMKNAMAKVKSCTSGKNLQQSAMILRQCQSEWLLLEDQFNAHVYTWQLKKMISN